VNTLTEFPSIQKVMILVKGQAGATLGNIILDKALDRMDELIGQ
jgi:spore germination protein GerM